MRPWAPEYAGRVEHREITSRALEGNPLGDPARRPITIYLPPSYDGGGRFPTIYLLQGFGGIVTGWEGRSGFTLSVPERLDSLFASNEVPECLVVYVDAWTSLGGSQFIDSPATGRYHTYLCEDVVEFIDENYRTIPDRDHRALQGHSSGGFGAIVNAMLRPDRFGAFASHAGDAHYDLWVPRELAEAYRALRDHYGRSFANYFEELAGRTPMSRPEDHTLVIIWAMAACYSAEPDGTVLLPFDTENGAIVPEVWQRWRRWDPVNMVTEHAEAMRSMRAIWIDAGRHDEYLFDIAAERLVAELHAHGVEGVAFEIFEGGHRHPEARFPLGTAYLARSLGK